MRVANTAPVAGDDSFSARPEFSLSIPFSALLGNDRDPDGGPLRLVGFTGTGHDKYYRDNDIVSN